MENSSKKTCSACSTKNKIGDGNICYAEITNCVEYTNEGVCQKCISSYKLVDNTCIACNLETEIIKGDKCYAKIQMCRIYKCRYLSKMYY